MANDKAPTIIIKKIKKGGHGHHGGAWKVAYADFVTAMMAFFLLMWLLAASSEEQLQGIAEYFTPTQGLKDAMGIGFEGGLSTSAQQGNAKNDASVPGLVAGMPEHGVAADSQDSSVVDGDLESQLFEDAKEEIKQAIESDPNLRDFAENVILELTPEGLKVTLRDSDGKSMFQSGSARLSEMGQKLLTAMMPTIRRLPNHLSITGHTDALNYEGKNGYSNWELSTDRAQSTRRYMKQRDLEVERVKKVIGRAAEELALEDDPYSPVNRRIDLILLRGSHMSLLPQNQTAPRSLISVPNARETLKRREERQSSPENAK